MNNNKFSRPVWMPLTKGFAVGLGALLIKYLTSLACLVIYSEETIISDIPNFAVCIVVFISSLFIYNSVFGLVFAFDRLSADEFFEFSDAMKDDPSEFKKIYYHKSFLLTAIPIVAVEAIAAAAGASWEIAGMFYFGEGKSAFSSGIVPFLAVTLLTSLYMLFERYEAVRYWRVLRRQGNLDELSSKPKIIFRTLFIIIVYPLLLPYLPMFAFVFITFLGTLAALITAPTLGAIVVGIILLIIGLRLLLALRRRKKTMNAIRTVAREHGYEISAAKNLYKSLFSRKKLCTFTIKDKKKTFDCLIIGHIMRGTPICFTSESEGYYRYRIGTKRHNITMQKHFTYSAEGDGRKIMIINPTPKYAYLADPESDKEKRIYNADLVWKFVAYEAEAFIGALDRDCLGKYSSTSDGGSGTSIPTLMPVRHGMNRFD